MSIKGKEEVVVNDEVDVIAYQISEVPRFTLAELKRYTKNFSEENELGRGGYGIVFRGAIEGREEEGLNHRLIAVKASTTKYEDVESAWLIECGYLSRLIHPNIIPLLGFGETDRRFFLIFPLMENGDISKKVADLTSDMDWQLTFRIIIGITNALIMMHDHGILHGDIKPANILLDQDNNPVLADFGSAREVGEISTSYTPGYNDIRSSGRAGKLSFCIYNLGKVILQLIMREKDVVTTLDQIELRGGSYIEDWAKRQIREGKSVVHESLMESGCSKKTADAIASLALDCLATEVGSRPDIKKVKSSLLQME